MLSLLSGKLFFSGLAAARLHGCDAPPLQRPLDASAHSVSPGHRETSHALTVQACMQAGRPITVVAADPLEMRRAILNPLSMGSRGRYLLVSGVQVPSPPGASKHGCPVTPLWVIAQEHV